MKSEAITELKKLGISKEKNIERWAKLGLEVSKLRISFYKFGLKPRHDQKSETGVSVAPQMDVSNKNLVS